MIKYRKFETGGPQFDTNGNPIKETALQAKSVGVQPMSVNTTIKPMDASKLKPIGYAAPKKPGMSGESKAALASAGVGVATGLAASATDDGYDHTNTTGEAASTIGGSTLNMAAKGFEMTGDWKGAAIGAAAGAISGIFKNKKNQENADDSLGKRRKRQVDKQNSAALDDLMKKDAALGNANVPLTGTKAVQTGTGYSRKGGKLTLSYTEKIKSLAEDKKA